MNKTGNRLDTDKLPHLITTRTAEELGVGPERTVRRLCETGKIKAVKVGNHWRINTAALREQFGI